MKRQLDRLKGKRLVTGDPNLMTKDEICINATPNGVEVKEIGTDGSIKDIANSGGGGGGSEELEYYRLGDVKFFDANYPDQQNYVIRNILLNKYPEIGDFNDSLTTYVGLLCSLSTEFMINFRTGQYSGHSVIGSYFIIICDGNLGSGQPMIAYFAIKKNINIITDYYYPNINTLNEQINAIYNSIEYVKELESITVKISKEEYDKAITIAKSTMIP